MNKAIWTISYGEVFFDNFLWFLESDFIVLVGVFDDESISEGSAESEDELEVVVAVHSRFETKEGELEFETGEIFEGWF